MDKQRPFWHWLVFLALTWLWCLACNPGVVYAPRMMQGVVMNDVDSIIWGYEKVPNLLLDSGRWWHGTWIQEGIHAWRPLVSYLYWIDCWLDAHVGRWTWGWVGLALLVVDAWVVAWLSWRLTRWRSLTVAAVLMLPASRLLCVTQPYIWLYWFPCHQEIAIATLMVASVALFDTWMENGRPRTQALFWLVFAATCATKETAFILPFMFGGFAAWRRFPEGGVERRRAWLLVMETCVFVGALWLYRTHCVADARNPSILLIQIPRKMGMYLANPFARYIISKEYGRALFPVIVAATALWMHARRPRWFVWLPVASLAVLWTFSLNGDHFSWAFSNVFDNSPVRRDWAVILAIISYLLLFWRFRRTEPTAATFTMVFFAYVPVIDYIGWHYDIVPWAFRVAQWMVVAKISWLYLIEENKAAEAWRTFRAWHPLRPRSATA